MCKLKIVYIDDKPDTTISRYLRTEYKLNGVEIVYDEIKFESNSEYDTLIDSEEVKSANIIVIDSRLFENSKVSSGKFTGEEFKIILKKIYPFIEVVVVTQNELEDEYGTVTKYKGTKGIDGIEYYNENLMKILNECARNIEIYRKISIKLKNNTEIDKYLLEKVLESLEGKDKFEELTKSDIDDLINGFKELKVSLDGE